MAKLGHKNCADCGEHYVAADGHKCRRAPASAAARKPARAKALAPQPVALEEAIETVHDLTRDQGEVMRDTPNAELTAQQRWRKNNIEHVRAKQREYQRSYRARKAAERADTGDTP